VAEADEFAMDAPVSPRRVLLRETYDQLAQLRCFRRPALATGRGLGPVPGNTFAVPAQQGFGCDDPALAEPARESRGDGAEQGPVVVVDRRLVNLAAQYLELVA